MFCTSFRCILLKPFLILVLLILGGALAALGQQLPEDRQARLDGKYAAIYQTRVDLAKQQLARGLISKAEADRAIQETTHQINQLRARWAGTRYIANFEKAFRDELNRPEPPRPPPGGNDPTPPDSTQPTSLSAGIKFLLFIAGVIVSRKLWKARVPEAEPVDIDYGQIKVELSPAEKAQLVAAQKPHNDTLAALDLRERNVSEKAARLAGRAGALARHIRRVADATTANASAELNR